MTISALVKEAHITAVEKGHHDFESIMHLKDAVVDKIIEETSEFKESVPEFGNHFNKDSEQSEIADIILVLMAYCGACSYDLEHILQLKMAYNKGRPFGHGK